MSRQSKLETSNLDDGSKNKRAVLNLFGRFVGKKAPANALRDWIDAMTSLSERVKATGYASAQPGVRRIPRDLIENVIDDVQANMDTIVERRDDFISDLNHMKQQIRDSYMGDHCYNEVDEALNRFHPNPDRMLPVFGVSDLCQGTGLVVSEKVTEAVTASELATKKSIVTILEDELSKLFERCVNPDRVRAQLKDAEGLIEKLGPLIREFSSNPDLVEKLEAGLKVLKTIPLDSEQLKEDDVQETVKSGLEIFQSLEVEEPEPEVPYSELEPATQQEGTFNSQDEYEKAGEETDPEEDSEADEEVEW